MESPHIFLFCIVAVEILHFWRLVVLESLGNGRKFLTTTVSFEFSVCLLPSVSLSVWVQFLLLMGTKMDLRVYAVDHEKIIVTESWAGVNINEIVPYFQMHDICTYISLHSLERDAA